MKRRCTQIGFRRQGEVPECKLRFRVKVFREPMLRSIDTVAELGLRLTMAPTTRDVEDPANV